MRASQVLVAEHPMLFGESAVPRTAMARFKTHDQALAAVAECARGRRAASLGLGAAVEVKLLLGR